MNEIPGLVTDSHFPPAIGQSWRERLVIGGKSEEAGGEVLIPLETLFWHSFLYRPLT